MIKEFYNETYTDRYGVISESMVTVTWSLTTALFIPGGMIGAFLGGWLADTFGRYSDTFSRYSDSHTYTYVHICIHINTHTHA